MSPAPDARLLARISSPQYVWCIPKGIDQRRPLPSMLGYIREGRARCGQVTALVHPMGRQDDQPSWGSLMVRKILTY